MRTPLTVFCVFLHLFLSSPFQGAHFAKALESRLQVQREVCEKAENDEKVTDDEKSEDGDPDGSWKRWQLWQRRASSLALHIRQNQIDLGDWEERKKRSWKVVEVV